MTTATTTRVNGADPLPRGTCLGRQNPDCGATIHGTYSAYVTFGCRCPHGREAARVYHKRHRENRSAPRLVDPTGTRRRLQALCAIGWRAEDLGQHLGLWQQNTHKLLQRTDQQVSVVTATRVKALYARLSGTPGSSPITRRRAIANGWPPPLAWEGVDIDDPNAQPVTETGSGEEPEGYDEITVGLAVDGRLTYEQIRHHRPDLVETVRRLAKRMTDGDIAVYLNWPGATDGKPGKTRGQSAVCQLRQRNGIPNHHAREVVAPTRTRDRARAARRHARQETRAA